MAASAGKGFLIQIESTTPGSYNTIGGLRSGRVAINSQPVDITTADSTYLMRELLAEGSVRSWSVTGSGIFEDGTGINRANTVAIANTYALNNFKVTVAGLGVFTFSGQITSLEYGGEYNAAETFSISIESSGAVTFA